MKSKNEARLKMYQSVVAFLLKNSGVTDPLPTFAALFLLLQSNIESILQIVKEQSSDRSGITVDKNAQRKEIVLRILTLSGKMVAYATLNKNNELLHLIRFTKSDLVSSTDHALLSHASLICDQASELLTELDIYNVTTDEIGSLRQLSAVFLDNIPKPREMRRDHRQLTLSLDDLMKETDHALLELDAVMLIVRFSNASFYDHYKNSRKVVETGTRGQTVRGLVTDSATSMGIKGVTVSFEPGNGNETKAGTELSKTVKQTADKGGFTIDSLETGTYRVSASKEGYTTQSLTVYITDGELTNVNIALQPL